MMSAMFPLPPLADEQRTVIDHMARLARERFAPRAAKYDAESSFPYENYADLHREGLLPLTVPKAYGGLGADPVTYAHSLRELARGCSATALTFNMHSTVTTFIAALGTDAQKGRFFRDVVERVALIRSATSGRMSAVCFSSPVSPCHPLPRFLLPKEHRLQLLADSERPALPVE